MLENNIELPEGQEWTIEDHVNAGFPMVAGGAVGAAVAALVAPGAFFVGMGALIGAAALKLVENSVEVARAHGGHAGMYLDEEGRARFYIVEGEDNA